MTVQVNFYVREPYGLILGLSSGLTGLPFPQEGLCVLSSGGRTPALGLGWTTPPQGQGLSLSRNRHAPTVPTRRARAVEEGRFGLSPLVAFPAHRLQEEEMGFSLSDPIRIRTLSPGSDRVPGAGRHRLCGPGLGLLRNGRTAVDSGELTWEAYGMVCKESKDRPGFPRGAPL